MDLLPNDVNINIISYINIYDKIHARLINKIFCNLLSKGLVVKYLILKTYQTGFMDGWCSQCLNESIDLSSNIQKINNICNYISDFKTSYHNILE